MEKGKAAISQKDILVLACERQRQIVDENAKHHTELMEQFGEKSQEAEWALVYWKKENQKLGQLEIMLQQEYDKIMPRAFAIR